MQANSNSLRIWGYQQASFFFFIIADCEYFYYKSAHAHYPTQNFILLYSIFQKGMFVHYAVRPVTDQLLFFPSVSEMLSFLA